MNPKYVTSLKLSQELKELGVKQKSAFYWVQVKRPKNPNALYSEYKQKDIPFKLCLGSQKGISGVNVYKEYSSFLSGELGEMLREYGVNGRESATPQFDIFEQKWRMEGLTDSKFEAEARGKMLAYLKKNKLI